MTKRAFRAPGQQQRRGDTPSYPTLEQFDRGRRDFLGRLGAIGAAVLGAGVLAACGERTVAITPDEGASAGGKPLPPARLDGGADAKPPQPDQQPPPQGEAPLPDARLDQPDAHVLAGDVPGPDARIDQAPLSGGAPAMDAAVDGCTTPKPPPRP